ncbi:MAG: mycothiol synthase [Actinobacteria bacterium]|nr:mycothiol synthase [Actinomycetota bacterium]
MERLVISDGTDTATLTPTGEHWVLTIDVPPGQPERGQRLMEAAAQAVGRDGGGRIEYWVDGIDDGSDRVPMAAGFAPFRDLWKLGRSLPAIDGELQTRPFRSDDADAFLDVNNRAFDWHPEQGGMTPEGLASRRSEPWYNDDGFRVWEDDAGNLGGFCWTKVHNDLEPPVGEIYAIAVDPEHRGRGLGRQLTLAGLEWLAAQGLRRVILYVESDNRHANRIYRELGFEREATNRAYQRILR